MKRSGPEKRLHAVAWMNKAEWDQVLEQLYSQEPGQQRLALQRLSAWRARFAHSTPVAVACTADLVRCQALDRSGRLDGDELVLLYGAALVRFINLITERQQGRKARPLRRLAGKLNIPEWVVDLRHDVTHKKLPTLRWCRKGCQVVLEWLQQEFWSRQLGGATAEEDWDSQSDGDEEEAELRRREDQLLARQKEAEAYRAARDLLESYEKQRYQNLDGSQAEEDGWAPPLADLSWLLGEVQQLWAESSDLLVDVLLEDGFLVPTAEQLETLGCSPDPADGRGPPGPQLPLAFLRFWLPLLQTLGSAPVFVHLLLEKLFAELKVASSGQNELRQFFVSAWAAELLLCNGDRSEFRFEKKPQRRARLKERVFPGRVRLRWQQLLAACLAAPCAATPRLLRLILDDMEHPLPQDTQDNLLRLCSIYTQTPGPQPGPHRDHRHQQPVYTLESLQRLQLLQSGSSRGEDALAEKARLLRGSPWQVSSDKVTWKNFPLGRVPGQPDDPSCLTVETFSTLTPSDQPEAPEGSGRPGVPGVSGPARTAEGLLWSQSDVSRLKAGLRLF